MFSRRVPLDLRPNALAEAAKNRGGCPFDLTVSNPTAVGIEYPLYVLAPLADPGGLAYHPDPKGLRSAREAVAASYAARGIRIDPERIVLCASTSEAYGLLFRLLCDPGDSVLVPVPSYPLFDHLAALDAVRAVPYLLDPAVDGQPHLGANEIARARAVLVVHPNNPTGHHIAPETAARLASACACQTLSEAGIPCEISAAIHKVQWTKLLWNAPFCAIGCLARANVQQIVASESLSALALNCMTEVQAAARARGIELRREQFDEIMTFSRGLGEFKPSMLQDLEAGKPLDYQAFNGIVLQTLRQAGAPAPINQAFFAMLSFVDQTLRAQLKS